MPKGWRPQFRALLQGQSWVPHGGTEPFPRGMDTEHAAPTYPPPPKPSQTSGLGKESSCLTLGTWLMLSSRGNLMLSIVRVEDPAPRDVFGSASLWRALEVPHIPPGPISHPTGEAMGWGWLK